ncbi:hypothetical protein FB567DRAFT_305756 [Paraphoma chrysanthemicola]|uniref:Uncharacterized protein n=1 Tax=Paraphoma chrysanthemicola TaxID=798071 RepID=A0A8K0W0Q8_9PLEO|nr:hypothetical protein FB567DRAFT_305756 [Paraphoma chrysanthemicola]
MRYLRALQILALATSVSAFAIRDTPLNLTTTAPWDPIATEIDDPQGTPFYKPHLESKVDGFDSPTTTSIDRNIATTVPPKADIGSLIQSYLSVPISIASQAPHLEKSEGGWEIVTQDPTRPTDILNPPHVDAPVNGPNGAVTVVVPSENIPRVTLAGVTQPRVTPPPEITQGGVTFRPEPVTSVRVVTSDGKPTTVATAVGFQYVLGSETIAIGTTTINNVVVALSIDSAGSTVLVAGGQTTTLPPVPQAIQAAQATDAPQALMVSTTIVDGTTKYVLAGQTLAPGQAITVGNVPISIGTAGVSTVLVVGDVTTTLPVGSPTKAEWGAAASATPGVVGGNINSNTNPASTSARADADKSKAASWLLAAAVGIAALAQRIV